MVGWVGLRTEEAHRRTSNHCLQIQISSPPDLQTVACPSSDGSMFIYGHFLEVRDLLCETYLCSLGQRGEWSGNRGSECSVPPALSVSTRFGLVLVWFGLRQYKSKNKFPQIIFDIVDWLTNLIVVGLCSVLLSPHTVYLRLKD